MNYLKILSIMIGTKKISLVDKYGAEIISPEEDRKIKYQNEWNGLSGVTDILF